MITGDLHCNGGLFLQVLAYLLEKMADIEYQLSTGAAERVQLAGLVGVFYNSRELLGDVLEAEA